MLRDRVLTIVTGHISINLGCSHDERVDDPGNRILPWDAACHRSRSCSCGVDHRQPGEVDCARGMDWNALGRGAHHHHSGGGHGYYSFWVCDSSAAGPGFGIFRRADVDPAWCAELDRRDEVDQPQTLSNAP